HGCHGLVVGGQLGLRDAVLGEQHLLGVRDQPSPSAAVDAGPSPPIPRRRGWRSFPCAVHSMKATVTTTAGRTQCAPARGSPEPRVNGGAGTSRASRRARSSRSILVSRPVPTLPANTKSPPSWKPRSSAPRPTRLPCGSVKPPSTNSRVASHFILSQW